MGKWDTILIIGVIAIGLFIVWNMPGQPIQNAIGGIFADQNGLRPWAKGLAQEYTYAKDASYGYAY